MPGGQMIPEQKLFQAVVLQAVEDACAELPDFTGVKFREANPKARRRPKGSRPFTKEYRQWLTARLEIDRARSWLLGGSRNFRGVCSFAGYEPGYVNRKANELAARGWRKAKRVALAA